MPGSTQIRDANGNLIGAAHPLPVSGGQISDATGQYTFNPDVCSTVNTYNADNTLATSTVTDPVTGMSFKQTYTYTAGNLTAVSAWVKQ